MGVSIAKSLTHLDVELSEPPRDCPLCQRLVEYRASNRLENPDWFNAPVPSFGSRFSQLLIVGLAPGVKGANRTGRPFTGDYAGLLLYETLLENDFAHGVYKADPADGLTLINCRITNTVRCVPPQNKPLPIETATCSRFLAATLSDMPHLRAVIALGKIAFDAVLRVYGLKVGHHRFAHGRSVPLPNGAQLFGSYHCSRYNTNTGRLTPAMFKGLVASAKAFLDTDGQDDASDRAR